MLCVMGVDSLGEDCLLCSLRRHSTYNSLKQVRAQHTGNFCMMSVRVSHLESVTGTADS